MTVDFGNIINVYPEREHRNRLFDGMHNVSRRFAMERKLFSCRIRISQWQGAQLKYVKGGISIRIRRVYYKATFGYSTPMSMYLTIR